MLRFSLFAAALVIIFSNASIAQNSFSVFNSNFDNIKEISIIKGGSCKLKTALDQDTGNPKPVVSASYEFQLKKFAFFFMTLKNPGNIPEFDEAVFKVLNDGSGNLYSFRIVDADGEHFHRNIALDKTVGWQTATIKRRDLRYDKNSGNREGNKTLNFPVKTIGLRITNFSLYGKSDLSGKVAITDLKLMSKTAGAQQLLSSSVDSGNVKTVVAEKAGTITLDGKLDDWNKTPALKLNDKTCTTLESNAEIPSAEFYVNYDDEKVYFAVKVKDSEPKGILNDSQIYQNDGIEMWFDVLNDSLLTMNQPDDYQLGLTYSTGRGKPGIWVWRNDKPAFMQAATKSAVSKTSDGYIIESSVPLAAFNGLAAPVEGQIIGFNISLCNSDTGKFSRLLWSGKNAGKPSHFGYLCFGKPSLQAMDAAKAKRKANTASFIQKSGLNKKYQGKPVILGASAASEASQYKKYEIDVDLSAEFDNPYDYDDFRLYAEFTAPNGKTYTVDGFYFQDYRLEISNKIGDQLTLRGAPSWKIRFAPRETGKYSYQIFAVDKKGRKAQSEQKSFTTVKSDSDGFLRVSKEDSSYLEHDSGKKFFGMGYAAHFWGQQHIVSYLKSYITQIAYFGGNYTSINLENIQNCGFALETGKLRHYNQESAIKLDRVLEIAEDRGVYIIPCLNQTSLALSRRWGHNKYNVKNGGPCQTPDEYFYNSEALSLIKNRTRYTMARWGYSTSILAWEIFNEVNYTDGFKHSFDKVLDFYKIMCGWLKEFDHSDHIVTNSFGSGDNCESPDIWRLVGIDSTITHVYSRDLAQAIYTRQATKLTYNKPNIGGEAGIPANEACTIDDKDPDGIYFHNVVWGSAFAKCAGNVLIWWPFRYIDPLDLGRQLTPFSKFQEDIDWPREHFQRGMVPAFTDNASAGNTDVAFPCNRKWGKNASPFYSLRSDGIWGMTSPDEVKITYIADTDLNVKLAALPGILFGSDKKEWSSPLNLKISTKSPTSLLLRFNAVSQNGASLKITRNGKQIKSLKLGDVDKQDNPYAEEMNSEVNIPLPGGGTNSVQIVNSGSGWAALNEVVIKDYAASGMVDNIRCFVLAGDNMSILWLQNAFSTWYQNSLGVKPESSENLRITVPARKDGLCEIEWWDTWNGEIISTDKTTSANGKVTVTPPAFTRDMAAKIRFK